MVLWSQKESIKIEEGNGVLYKKMKKEGEIMEVKEKNQREWRVGGGCLVKRMNNCVEPKWKRS